MSDLPVPVVNLPETPRPQTLVCANCHAELAGEYCAACGQRHEPHIHTVAHFAGEAFESISHADSRLWRTLWYLFSRPGFLTREFFAGRRVAYLPPFRLYLVLSVIFFLLTSLSSGDADYVDPALIKDPATAALKRERQVKGAAEAARQLEATGIELPGEAARQIAAAGAKLPEDADRDGLNVRVSGLDEFCQPFIDSPQGGANSRARSIRRFCDKIYDDNAELFKALVHSLPKAIFIFLPLLAGIMKLMYWRPKRYYVEHLLFLVHNHAFVFLIMILFALVNLLIDPLIGDYVWPFYVAGSCYTIWYIFRAMRNMYGQHGFLTFIKYVVLGWSYIFTAVITLLFTLIFLAVFTA